MEHNFKNLSLHINTYKGRAKGTEQFNKNIAPNNQH
jgi:hypothetical protein